MKSSLLIILIFTSFATWAQIVAPAKTTSDKTIYDSVTQMPQFPGTAQYRGGETGLLNFLMHNIRWPKEALESQIEGVEYVSFVVNTDGTISDIKVVKDIGGGCGDEVIRVIKLMPKWTPGKNNGLPVNVRYVLPVNFKLR